MRHSWRIVWSTSWGHVRSQAAGARWHLLARASTLMRAAAGQVRGLALAALTALLFTAMSIALPMTASADFYLEIDAPESHDGTAFTVTFRFKDVETDAAEPVTGFTKKELKKNPDLEYATRDQATFKEVSPGVFTAELVPFLVSGSYQTVLFGVMKNEASGGGELLVDGYEYAQDYYGETMYIVEIPYADANEHTPIPASVTSIRPM